MYKSLSKVLLIALLLGLLAPATTSVVLAQDPAACQEDYNVQADDWLSKIAEKVYGDALTYPLIAEATNLKATADDSYATIDNVDVIEPGWKLCIPVAQEALTLLTGPTSIEEQVECSQNISTPGYFSSINGAEVTDAQRSQLYPCAIFPGSLTEANSVTAIKSAVPYQGVTFFNSRNPGEMFMVGGDSPPPTGTVPPGPYVAKFVPETGEEIWRTVLDDASESGRWIATSNLNILDDGNIVFAWSHFIVLIDPDTGAVLNKVSLPSGPAGDIDGHYKHLTIAPDGTIILKQQNRPFGCETQGSLALITCPGAAGGSDVQANSLMLAINPQTLEVYDEILLPEMTAVPHIITTFQDKIAIYAPGSTNPTNAVYRYFWDPDTKKLSQDTTFVASILGEGQTTGDAPGVLGDWIIIQTNGLFAEVPSSIVALNQNDPTNFTAVYPHGELESGGQSWAPPKAAVDIDNNMVYSVDQRMGKNAGIKIDPSTGEMTTVWVIDDASTALQALVGPKDERVLATSRINPSATLQDIQTGNYTEQALWLNAATGEILAQSDYFEPMGLNTMLTPGFGGYFYFPTGEQFYILEVTPASN